MWAWLSSFWVEDIDYNEELNEAVANMSGMMLDYYRLGETVIAKDYEADLTKKIISIGKYFIVCHEKADLESLVLDIEPTLDNILSIKIGRVKHDGDIFSIDAIMQGDTVVGKIRIFNRMYEGCFDKKTFLCKEMHYS